MKTCTRCYIGKSADRYYKDSRLSDGLRSHCKDCHYIESRSWVVGHRERINELARGYSNRGNWGAWKKQNPDKVRAYNAARQRRLKCATPPWARVGEVMAKLAEIYLNRPEGHVVDHIIPLTNKQVSGLHVPWNLQYLPKLENTLKHNKYEVTY